jgi:hypothetical protein
MSNTETMTTETFADFAATQQARNSIQLNVRKWTLMLCDALLKNYIDYSIKSHQRYVKEYGNIQNVDIVKYDYHQTCIEDLKNGQCGYKFYIESGRKYHKVIMETNAGSRSVHAFVDKKTGEVYKAASYKSPAKIVRYRLLEIASRELCFERADWAGGYLYVR